MSLESENPSSGKSPALEAELARRFEPEICRRIMTIYGAACEHGALDEPGVKRLPGASFNPRPARIAQIILSSGAECTPEIVAAGVMACADTRIRGPICGSAPDPQAELAGDAQAVLRSGQLPADISRALGVILLAHALDSLRHLHMREASPHEIARTVSDALALCEKTGEISGIGRLIELVRHAASRFMEA